MLIGLVAKVWIFAQNRFFYSLCYLLCSQDLIRLSPESTPVANHSVPDKQGLWVSGRQVHTLNEIIAIFHWSIKWTWFNDRAPKKQESMN